MGIWGYVPYRYIDHSHTGGNLTGTPLPADIAVAFIEAFGRNDMTTLASYLAEDVKFESPMADLSGAGAVTEAIGQFAQTVSAVQIITSVGDHERAVIMYDMETGPFGRLRAAEHLVIRDGKIASDQLVFDTHEVRKLTQG